MFVFELKSPVILVISNYQLPYHCSLCKPWGGRLPAPSAHSVASKWQLALFIAPAYSKVRYRGSTFRPFVQSSVNNSWQGVWLCSSDSWEYETLHSNYPWQTLQAGTLTQCPWPSFHAPLTLSKVCIESRKFTTSLEIKFISLQQW